MGVIYDMNLQILKTDGDTRETYKLQFCSFLHDLRRLERKFETDILNFTNVNIRNTHNTHHTHHIR